MSGKKAAALAAKVAELERKLLEANAAQPYNYRFASDFIANCGKDARMGSGVIISISALGGKSIVDPVLIHDGLSDASIAALREDIYRSFKLATEHTLKG